MTDNDHLDLLVYVGPLRGDTPTPTRAKFVGTLRFADSARSVFFQYSSDWIWGIEHEPHNFFAIDPRLKLLRGAWQPIELVGFIFDAHPGPVEYARLAWIWLRARVTRNSCARKVSHPSLANWVSQIAQMPTEIRLGAFRLIDPVTGQDASQAEYWLPRRRQVAGASRALSQTLSESRYDALFRRQAVRRPQKLKNLPVEASLPGYDFNVKIACRDNDGQLITCVLPFDHDGKYAPNETSWIAAQLAMAKKAGIDPAFIGITNGKGKPPTVMLRRFDRDGTFKIPFMSAATIMGLYPSQPTSFVAIAKMISSWPNHASRDLEQLWRRVVFGCLADLFCTSLTVGFLWQAGQWRLAPMWHAERPGGRARKDEDREARWLNGIESAPEGISSPPLAIGPEIKLPRLEDALNVAETFGLDPADAEKIAGTIGVQVKAWRNQARVYGVAPNDIEQVSASFDTFDLELACSYALPAARVRQRGMGRG